MMISTLLLIIKSSQVNYKEGGGQYTMMKIYILVGSDGLGKPFWERKLIGESTSRQDSRWKEFVGGWYCLITRMTSALYMKEILRSWYRDDEKKYKHLWELLSVSDVAYTIFVLENHSEI
jgi:hypothetical protein